MIFVNFKTYKESSGEKAVSLAKKISEVSSNSGIEIISCPQGVDIKEVLKVSQHSVWAQHTDPQEPGKATGWLPPETLKAIGVTGVLLNHSEHKLSVGVLDETMTMCKKTGLETLVFAGSLDEAKTVAKFEPNYIGYEPPELVGSKEESVLQAKPDIIEKVVKEISWVPIIVGAGVKSSKDVEVGLNLGAKGIAVSSAVVLAEDQEDILMELARGFKS